MPVIARHNSIASEGRKLQVQSDTTASAYRLCSFESGLMMLAKLYVPLSSHFFFSDQTQAQCHTVTFETKKQKPSSSVKSLQND